MLFRSMNLEFNNNAYLIEMNEQQVECEFNFMLQ